MVQPGGEGYGHATPVQESAAIVLAFAGFQSYASRQVHEGRKGARAAGSLAGSIILAIGVVLATPSTVSAADFHCSGSDVPCLIAAINTANGNGEADTIFLEAGTYTLTAVDNTDAGPSGLPSISSDITIHGEGASLTVLRAEHGQDPQTPSGLEEFRIFHVAAAGDLKLEGLTVSGGFVDVTGHGGGIFNQGALSIAASVVRENGSGGGVGGILSEGTLKIRGSRVEANGSDHGGPGGISSSGTMEITTSTVSGNQAEVYGGIFTSGVASITESVIANNFAFDPTTSAGIDNGGTLTITNTTIAGNSGQGRGGAIRNGGSLRIQDSTITDNSAVVDGGGILNQGTAELQNTILARNSKRIGQGPDCFGPITSLGHNIVGDPTDCTITLLASDKTGDPGLGSFQDDGTPGNGHVPLLATSQAIDAGGSSCTATDQLGRARVDGDGDENIICDIGAVEFIPAATTIVVNDAGDSLHSLGCAKFGTGTCTFRDAITFANAHAGPDEIHFEIAGSGVHTITLGSDLPGVAGDLTIDGYTQTGSSPNTNGAGAGLGDNAVLTIEINGNGKGCLVLFGYANTVRGLVINRCGGAGVGSEVPGTTSIAGNFIGVNVAGTEPLPNETGVLLGGDLEVVGGATPDARNLISGNRGAGVSISQETNLGVVLRGNFIGTDVTGTKAVANGGSGVDLGFPSASLEMSENVVSGNAGRGVSLNFTFARIHENLIGTDVSGTLPLGNRSTGIWLVGSDGPKGVISGNTIAFNGIGDPIGGGIVASELSANHQYQFEPTILGNSIFENTSDGSVADRGLGIDLVGRTNETDLGPGPNYRCGGDFDGINPPTNFPVLTAAVATESAITLRGVLDGRTGRSYRIEFFASPTCDPSGYGEGKTFLGSTSVTAGDFDGNGNCFAEFDVTLPVAVPVGEFVTATATDASTSEFSLCVPVKAAPAPEVVNQLATLVSLTQTRSHAPVTGGPAGTMTIRATFKNTSSTPIDTPFFVVTDLSEGNVLLNADGSPSGVGAKLTPDVGADKLLSPGESFTTEFVVGLQNRRRFRFFVDLWGVPIP